MRLTTLGILFCIMQVSSSTFAQRITLKAKNISYGHLFKTIEQQSGYTFVYDPDILHALPNVNIEINDGSITEVMDKTLANKPLSYKIIDKTVVLRLKETMIAAPPKELIYIPGKVIDQSGHGLAGVTVTVKGPATAGPWVTNTEGRFNALVNPQKTILVYSYVGYQTQEIRIEDLKPPFTIQLKEDIAKLDEIQVIAYGQTIKRFNVGDQTTVTAKEIEKYPVGNVLSVLQGTVPGMTISQSTGQAGSTYNVVIRGQNGFITSSAPLYIIDGIPYIGGGYTSQKATYLGSGGQAYDALDLINPLDIESINVLKDADATSIYGSRGANGVILITTKKGKAGDTRIDINVFNGVSQTLTKPQYFNTGQYLQMRKEAKKNDGATILPTDYDINGTWDTTRYTNWPQMFLKGTGYSTNAQVSISGGGSSVSYLISGNYRRTSNVQQLIGGADQISSLHFNLNSASDNKKFNIQFTGGYTYDFNNIPSADLSFYANLPPDAPALYSPDGSLNFQNNTSFNPLVFSKLIARTSLSNLTSSMVASYALAKGLKAQATVGYNKQSLAEFLATPLAALQPITIASIGAKGTANYTWTNKSFWSLEPQLDYNRSVSKGALDVLVGASLQKQLIDNTELQAKGYDNDLLINNIAAAATISPIGVGYSAYNYKYSALYSRLNYNWENKYIIDLSGRYDGSSKFGQNRQFHFFYATGGAWIFSSENVIKNALPFLSFGKLRGSYGTTGNDQIGAYQYLENFSPVTSANPYQGVLGIVPGNLPNPYLSWETTTKANIGLELQFLKGRIGLQGDLFRNRTSDLLVPVQLPLTTGFTSITQNIDAKTQNKGFDISLNTINIQSGNLSWSTTIMISKQRNTLFAIPNTNDALTMRLNQPVNVIFVNRYAGVDPQTGLYQFYDKDGKIVAAPSSSGSDETKPININPGYFGSVSNSISFNGFTVSFIFRGTQQTGQSTFGQILSSGNPLGIPFNPLTLVSDHWQKPGDVARFGKFTSTFGATAINALNAGSRLIDAYYSNASYIRLQNASLSYQFDDRIAKKCHLRSLKVYMLGENLATITGYEVLDPETQSLQKMPPLRTITFGIQASL